MPPISRRLGVCVPSLAGSVVPEAVVANAQGVALAVTVEVNSGLAAGCIGRHWSTRLRGFDIKTRVDAVRRELWVSFQLWGAWPSSPSSSDDKERTLRLPVEAFVQPFAGLYVRGPSRDSRVMEEDR